MRLMERSRTRWISQYSKHEEGEKCDNKLKRKCCGKKKEEVGGSVNQATRNKKVLQEEEDD
jgi:hypothetical protein